MSSRFLPRLALPSALLCGMALGAQEAPAPRPRFYMGLALGSQQTRQDAPVQGGTVPLNRGTFSFLGGVELGRTWGAEMGFHFLGDYPAGSTTDAYGTVTWSRSVTGLALAGTGRLPLGRRVSLAGWGGLMIWSSQPRSQTNGWATLTDGRDSGRTGGTPLLGAGLHLDLTPTWRFRLDAEVAHRVMDARLTRWSGGFVYRF